MDLQPGIAILNGAQLPSHDAVTRQHGQCFSGPLGAGRTMIIPTPQLNVRIIS